MLLRLLTFIILGLTPLLAADNTNQRDLINQALKQTNLQKADAGKGALEDGGSFEALTSSKTKIITWRGVANVAADYVSNANYRTTGGDGSALFSMSAESGLHAKLSPQWEVDAYVRPEAAFYTSIKNADYWGLTSVAEVQYKPWSKGPQLYAGTELYRFESFASGEEINRGVSPFVGARYSYAIEKTRTYFFSSYQYNHFFVTPSVDDRDSHTVMLGVTQEIMPHFYGQAYYQFQYSDYENISRSDLRHVAGVALIYEFNQYVSLRLGGSYSTNDSTATFASYENFTGGLASSFRYEF